tara:strand:- start:140 stop:319 length:180 start_codon:yes stop_codon:yes gene_type:complete
MNNRGQTMKKKKQKKTKNEKIFDKNLEFMSDENNMISEEDYYLSEALAQDGESIENYGI